MRLRWLLLGPALVGLLVVSAAVTAARVLAPTGGTWVRLAAFTPYATGLYLAAFLLLLPAVAGGRRFWRGLAGLAATAALLGLVMHVAWASGPFLGDPGTPATTATATEPARQLRVMTSNLMFGGADVALVVAAAEDHEVDVLVVQEVTAAALRGLEDAGVDRVLPH
ncbi:MAG: hypothetical protein WB798_17445, partial [Nocardioidaceae bacterium]